MIDFRKLFEAVFFINLAIAFVNYALAFPVQWSPHLKPILDLYNSTYNQLSYIQGLSDNMFMQFGAFVLTAVVSIVLIIPFLIMAPVFVCDFINSILADLGIPVPIGYIFLLPAYLGFVFFVFDVLRGRLVNPPG